MQSTKFHIGNEQMLRDNRQRDRHLLNSIFSKTIRVSLHQKG